jgi:WD40 repeat protein
VAARQLAESRDRYSRRLLYVSDMSLARIEFSSGNVSRGLDLLDAYLPGSTKSSVDDERSFYWYYLWSTFHNEERTLAGHDDEVTEVAYAPDGRTLASGGFADHMIKLWNPSTGAQLAELPGHSLPISGLLFFPDGHRLLSSSNDESVRIWDVAATKQLQQLDGDKGFSISSIAINSVGDKVAAVSRDVKLWNLQSHSTSSIPTLEKFGFYIAFSPDDRLLAWSTSGAQIRV